MLRKLPMIQYLVLCVRSVGLEWLYDDVAMEEMGGDHTRHKRRVLLLKHDRYNVVTYMPLPLKL